MRLTADGQIRNCLFARDETDVRATLRDGTQGEGVSFSMEDKVRIAQRLDALGIHYIEGGWPGANPLLADYGYPPYAQTVVATRDQEVGHQAVFFFAAQFLEQVFVEFAGALEAAGVCGFALEDGDLFEASRLGKGLDGGGGVEVSTFQHEFDLTGHE